MNINLVYLHFTAVVALAWLIPDYVLVGIQYRDSSISIINLEDKAVTIICRGTLLIRLFHRFSAYTHDQKREALNFYPMK